MHCFGLWPALVFHRLFVAHGQIRFKALSLAFSFNLFVLIFSSFPINSSSHSASSGGQIIRTLVGWVRCYTLSSPNSARHLLKCSNSLLEHCCTQLNTLFNAKQFKRLQHCSTSLVAIRSDAHGPHCASSESFRTEIRCKFSANHSLVNSSQRVRSKLRSTNICKVNFSCSTSS